MSNLRDDVLTDSFVHAFELRDRRHIPLHRIENGLCAKKEIIDFIIFFLTHERHTFLIRSVLKKNSIFSCAQFKPYFHFHFICQTRCMSCVEDGSYLVGRNNAKKEGFCFPQERKEKSRHAVSSYII